MTHHKPTRDELATIRAYALEAAGIGRVSLEAGSRLNTETPRGFSINIRLISDDEDWSDTDLFDMVSWSDFKRDGFDLAPGGRAVVDFYVYSTGRDGELETNVQAIWEGGRLVRLDQTAGPSKEL